MRVKVTGLDKVLQGFDRESVAVQKSIDEGVVATAAEVQREAINSINLQSPGRKVRKGQRIHVVSRPGDAPNTDTGRLVGSIAISHIKGSKVAYVFTDLDYGLYLEAVKERPWLHPALIEKQDNLPANVRFQLIKRLRK